MQNLLATTIRAASANDVIGKVSGVPQSSLIPKKAEGIGGLISSVLSWVMPIAALVCLAMLIMGGFQYMTSGGDKTKTANARNRMIFAVVGLVVVSAAFAITYAVQEFVGLDGPIQMGTDAVTSKTY